MVSNKSDLPVLPPVNNKGTYFIANFLMKYEPQVEETLPFLISFFCNILCTSYFDTAIANNIFTTTATIIPAISNSGKDTATISFIRFFHAISRQARSLHIAKFQKKNSIIINILL